MSKVINFKNQGLTSQEAQKRLQKFGPNEIRRGKRVHPIKILLSQFSSPLVILLIVSAIISWLIGYLPGQSPNLTDSILILAIVFVAGIAGFIQDYKAEKSIEALQKMTAPRAKVIRDGEEKEIKASELVPGDLILLTAGDIVPADAKIIKAFNLKVNEAVLTGESGAIEKKPSQEVFMNSYVYVGEGQAVVLRTGMRTKMGQVASRLQKIKEEKKPLDIKITLLKGKEKAKEEEFVSKKEFEQQLKTLQKSTSELTMEFEKVKVSLEALKEGKKATDERLQGLAESIGEIRSMLFEREAKLKEQQLKLEKVFTIMEELEPEKFLKTMSKRDQKLSEHDMKFEKLEMLTSELSKDVKKLKETLNAMGSLENLVELDKRIAKKLSEMDDRAKSVERISSKIEKLFLDLNKKLEEFETYRLAQERMEESLNETMKTLTDISMKLEDYVTRDELNAVKDLIKALQDEIQKLREEKAKLKIPPEVEELQKEKESIQALLESLEEQYKNRSISEEEYVKVKETNLKRIEKIEEKLRELTSGVSVPEVSETNVLKKAPSNKEISNESVEEKLGKEEKQKVVEKRIKAPKKKEKWLSELEDLLKLGLISRDAYEKTRRMLEAG